MLKELKKQVFEANIALPRYGLVTLTWGNVSEIDRETGYVVIKPSGIRYEAMRMDDLVVVDLDGNIVEGRLRPSSDAPTHLELYRQFPEIGGITHTHSRWATIFAQCGMDLPALGTTHADTFYGPVPCTRNLRQEEIFGAYELETGRVIAETISQEGAASVPAVLVHSHGPFTWGSDALKSVEHSVILEEVAMMAWHTLMMNPDIRLKQDLLDKHYLRKHGKNAYYGQGGNNK